MPFVCRRRHILLSVWRSPFEPSERGSTGPSALKTTPASSKAWRIAATWRGFGFLDPFSKSRIVGSLICALAASRTRDQLNRARAAFDCSPDSRARLRIGVEHSTSLKYAVGFVRGSQIFVSRRTQLGSAPLGSVFDRQHRPRRHWCQFTDPKPMAVAACHCHPRASLAMCSGRATCAGRLLPSVALEDPAAALAFTACVFSGIHRPSPAQASLRRR